MPPTKKSIKVHNLENKTKATKKRIVIDYTPETPIEPIVEPPKEIKLKARRRCPQGSKKGEDGKCYSNITGELIEEVVLSEPAEIINNLIHSVEPPLPIIDIPHDSVQSSPLPDKIAISNKKTNEIEIEEGISSKTKHRDYLYPSLNDPDFNIKIALRKEFNDTQFDGEIYDIEKHANEMCNAKFELSPHQLFVKNFLSLNTPYKSILLYHGLGTGKTCSAIGIAEEMRNYIKNTGVKEKILVVASPNVQGNFRTQLFDENKLKQIPHPTQPNEFIWNLDTCVGSYLLEEIDPTGFNKLPRDKVITNINTIIYNFYDFKGYGQLANYINEKIGSIGKEFSEKEKRTIEMHNIQRAFNNRLIIIDEVHNLKDDKIINEEAENTTGLLLKIAKYSINLRFLLLSATPMYNSHKEIIWLTNLMNVNDKRPTIEARNVFDKDGNFKPAFEKSDKHKYPESGEELLRRKLTGYISFVRGENPYTFPYRIYPSKTTFAKESSLDSLRKYPSIQMNGKKITEPLKYIQVFLNKISADTPQYHTYRGIIEETTEGMENFGDMDKFGYDLLKTPLSALNITFPITDNEHPEQFVGKVGFNNTFKPVGKTQFDYHPNILKEYGRVFNPSNIAKYSCKISSICESIRNSEGIVIVYSRYLSSGIWPMAMALEEMGFSRYSSNGEVKNILHSVEAQPLDSLTMLPKSQVAKGEFHSAKYIMITGKKEFSPSNTEDVKYATLPENKDGAKVKVILISEAGSEGLDFKCVRQVHIMEPWYNMSRIEQIIGRGVRNLSHCRLPFEKRNVQLFLHGTILENSNEEAADMYVYRSTERKTLKIGRVTRLMKTIAVDCNLNIGQTNFTAEKLMEHAANKRIKQTLSDKTTISFRIGDKPFTDICDYMETCDFQCSPRITASKMNNPKNINSMSYLESFALSNKQTLAKRIRELFHEKHVYTRDQLIHILNTPIPNPPEQIFSVLSLFIHLRGRGISQLIDRYGRTGYLVNHGEQYAFQPMEIEDTHIDKWERETPIPYIRNEINLELPKEVDKSIIMKFGEDLNGTNTTKAIKTTDDLGAKMAKSDFVVILEYLAKQFVKTQTQQEIFQGNKDWYAHFSNLKSMFNTTYKIPLPQLDEYAVYHALDSLTHTDKLILLNYLYDPKMNRGEDLGDLPNKMRKYSSEYFQKKVMESNAQDNLLGIILCGRNNTYKLFVKSREDNNWKETDEADIELFMEDLRKMIIPDQRWSNLIGFISEFKEHELVFKTKYIRLTQKNKGARCDSAGKSDIIKKLNQLIGQELYTSQNTAHIMLTGMCAMLEILMREYTRIKKNGMVYFFSSEEAAIMDVINK